MIGDLAPFFAEIVVLAACIVSLTAGLYRSVRGAAGRIVFAGLAAAFVLTLITPVSNEARLLKGVLFVSDHFARNVKLLILAGTVFSLAFGLDWLAYKKYRRYEFPALLGLSAFGMMTAVSAGNFLTQFLGLEIAQAPLSFLAAFKKSGDRSTEAGVKFVIASLLGSGLWLFGMSVIYAVSGTSDFKEIAAIDKTAVMPAMLFGLSFLTVGAFIRIGVVPFHFWLPDVYEGAPSPVTAFFGLCARVAFMACFVRLVAEPFAGLTFFWYPVLSVAAVLSVVGGALGMLTQRNFKRLAAYAMITANGFSLAALSVGNRVAFTFYTVVDGFAAVGLFAIMLSLRVGDALGEDVSLLNGQGREKPVRGALFSLVFFSLSGLPPFSGFWAIIAVAAALFSKNCFFVSAVLMIGTLIPAYVFLKLVRQMYFTPASEKLLPAPKPMKIALLLSAGAAISLPLLLEHLARFAAKAAGLY